MSPTLGTVIGPKLYASSLRSFKLILVKELLRPYKAGELFDAFTSNTN